MKWHKHCWHLVPDSKRKVKARRKGRCTVNNNPYQVNGTGPVVIQETARCCRCGKTKIYQMYDYEVSRGLSYPAEEEQP